MYTLDHNILIDIKHKTEWGELMFSKIKKSPESFNIVNIGASELREGGIRPDNYSFFEIFLRNIGVSHLKRLNPLGLIDITFINHGVICSDEDAVLYEELEKILFPNGFESGEKLILSPPYQPIERKRLNQICDTAVLWCHLKYKTTALITRDDNFHKKSKILNEKYGAKIVRPEELP